MADPVAARLSDQLFWLALVAYAISMVGYFASLAYRARKVGTIATALAWIGWIGHAASVAARGVAAGRVPWGNMFEYSSMVGLLIVLTYLLVLDRRLGLRSVGGFATGAAVLALASARLTYAPPGPLVPALNSYWLRIHVVAAILGSTLFGISFILTVLTLVKRRAEKRDPEAVPARVAYAALRLDSGQGLPLDLDNAEESVVGPPSREGALSRFPNSSNLDALTHRTIGFAFLVWTFAVVAGAVWAHEAWGRYWGWDPKETWAFVTWVVYAGYLHARSTAGWRSGRAAIISCLGFASVLFTYYAVNLWISGLHSYAGVE